MANEKKYLEFLDIPDGNGGSERWYSKDAEAQASIAKVASALGINPDDFVDLGLPSGTLWAKCNVGANAETGYGNYYMYGKGATQYSNGDTTYAGEENPLDAEHDTAVQVLGAPWHTPTKAQFEELVANTTFTWETDFLGSGIKGGKYTAANGNYVFFPAAGIYMNGVNPYAGLMGACYTSTPSGSNAYYFGCQSNGTGITDSRRDMGLSIRPVISKTILGLIEDSKLNPVNINTLTPSSTFHKNDIIGINGVIYRAKKDTANFPVVLVVEQGAFVVHTVNGKIAFVVSNPTINQDWEIFTDAAIEYWVESLNAALAAKQNAIADLEEIRSNSQNAIKATDEYVVNGVGYPVSALLQAVANLMSSTIVVKE